MLCVWAICYLPSRCLRLATACKRSGAALRSRLLRQCRRGWRAGGVDAQGHASSRGATGRAAPPPRAYKAQRVPRTDVDDATDADEDADERGCAMPDQRVAPSHSAGVDGDGATEGAAGGGPQISPGLMASSAFSSSASSATSSSCGGAAGGGFMRWGRRPRSTRIFSMDDLDDDDGGEGDASNPPARGSGAATCGSAKAPIDDASMIRDWASRRSVALDELLVS